MRIEVFRMPFALVLLVLCLVPAARSQSGDGTVKGNVLDATGATIPGAKVTLTNTETNIARQSETSAVGSYEFPAVRLGPYALEVELAGFKKWSGTFTVQTGDTVVIDPALEVGSVDTVIEVTGVAPVITTEGMEVGDVKDALRIRQLPLNGRFVTNLFSLTPGVEGGSSPRVNGMKVGSVEMTLDGISLVSRFGGGMARAQPGLDTIEEFRIETVGSSAKSRSPATVTLVTKSGTNQFHGTVFETHRNNAANLRARRRQDGDEASKLIRNEFGGSAGGPIIKNKTFFFGAYEGRRERSTRFARGTVPTADNWNGDFSNAIDNNSRFTTIYDPLTTRTDGTRDPFINNTVPTNRLTPFAKNLSQVVADPTTSINPFQGQNFEANYGDNRDFDSYTAKIDHRFSDSDNLSGRFTLSERDDALLGGRFGLPKLGCDNCFGTGSTDSRVFSTVLDWNHVFSPTLLNEIRVAQSRIRTKIGTLADETDWSTALGLPNPFGATGWPTLSGFSPFGSFDADNRQNQHLSAYQIEDDGTWIKGNHSIKFGGKVRYEYSNVRTLQQAQGSNSFQGRWTSLFDPAGDQAVSFTGTGLADMLLGIPNALSNQFNRGFFYFEQQEVAAYFHDSWKVHPRLTLELGVRWDKWTAYDEKFDRLVDVDLETITTPGLFQVVTPKNVRLADMPGVPPSVLASWAARGLTEITAQELGNFPDNLVAGDHNNFGPRIGAAFKLTDKFIIRGSYGEYFWPMPLAQVLEASRSNPPLNLRFVNDLASRNGAVQNNALKNAPNPDDFIGLATVPTESSVPISSNARTISPFQSRDWKDNRMQAWHFTLEREVMRDTSLRLSYIGNHGRDLEQKFEINGREAEFNFQARTGLRRPSRTDDLRPNGDWNVRATNNEGFSNSHSFQAELERRYSNGLAFQLFYTFSRVLTTNDTNGFSSGGARFDNTAGRTLVPENSQILGSPSLSFKERLDLVYYNSGQVPPQRVRWNAIYDLPFGRGKKFGDGASGALNHVLGGWQVASIGTWRSGNWSSIDNRRRFLFGDPTLDGDERLEFTFAGRRQRLFFRGDFDPARASNVDQAALERLVPADRGQRLVRPQGPNFDNRVPQTLADGSVRMTPVDGRVVFPWNAKNFFRGPGAWNVDFSVFKHFDITETVKARVTADFFNMFNHPLDASPNNQTGLQDLSIQTNEPRIIQLSLRFSW